MSNACSFEMCKVCGSVPALVTLYLILIGIGFFLGQQWMFNRARQAATAFGMEAIKRETIQITAIFACVDACALHYALYLGWKRLCGLFRGRGEGKTGV